MNNDAKFLFFTSGFAGFILFYFASILIHGDLIIALIKASVGCLVVGWAGRIILGLALTHSTTRKPDQASNNEDPVEEKIPSSSPDKFKSKSLDEIAAATNLEAVSKRNSVSTLVPSR